LTETIKPGLYLRPVPVFRRRRNFLGKSGHLACCKTGLFCRRLTAYFPVVISGPIYYAGRNKILSGEDNMKKHLLYLALVFVFMAAVGFPAESAFADAPQDLSLSYDLKTQTLSATITHKSMFTGLHYVKQVQIKKNQEPLETVNYDSQAGKVTFVYTYKVPAKPNDLLEVTAVCNLQGQKTAMLKVQ